MYDEDMTYDDINYCSELESYIGSTDKIEDLYTSDDMPKIGIKNLFLDYMDSAPFAWVALRTTEWNNFEIRFDLAENEKPSELAERIVNYYTRHLALMETFEKP